ncbi:MAG: leucine-rich repeat domain-containing protein [Raineya sp.]|jgi:Leucine-rich repeat (LRR) protein|nr:leucine-rich repeat domain-containing protein [Raineya sp.]
MKKYILLLTFFFKIITISAQYIDIGFTSEYIDSVARGKIRYTSLEEALKKPEKVEILILKNKGFKTFPTEIFKFKNLQILNLDENQISDIPPQINQLKKLVGFAMQMNQLKTLPKEFGELNLVELRLSANLLIEISYSITNQKNMKDLHLDGNYIEIIPLNIDNLENLEVFYIGGSNVKIKFNVESMKKLKKLKIFFLCTVQKKEFEELKRHFKKEYGYFSNICN